MKKLFLTILITLLAISSSVFFACGEPNYHEVVYTKVDGVTYVSEFFPYMVKEGKSISFKLDLATNSTGSPIVYANGQVITPDANGVYVVVINESTIIDVDGVELIENYDITFDTADGYVHYEVDGENVDDGLTVEKGDTISLKVSVSVYYKQEYKVAANTEFLTPDANGNYNFEVLGDVNVSVIGLEQEECYLNRPNGGRGTESDPYRIEKPIDLFYMAQVINDDFYQGAAYYEKCYKLMNDIDLNGEQMFVIGDNTTSTAFFAGRFDGNGHKISNFYLSDTLTGQDVFLPYLGMFGFCSATTGRSPQIYNLTLEDFSLYIDGGKYETTFFAGGIVGFGIGVDIAGCHVQGSVYADADYGYFGYIGGVIGGFQSAYSSDDVRFYSSVRSCSANVDVSAQSGYVYGAGGITGVVMSYEERTNAFILNCHTEGYISGALNTGGIVGSAQGNTSVIGSYSIATVSAKSTIPTSGDDEVDIYTNAYGGGIVGYADYNSIVSDCFFDGTVSAYSAFGSNYEFKGDIVGDFNKQGKPTVESLSAVILNNYSSKETTLSNEFLKNTLNFSEEDWVFNENGYPTINLQETTKTFTVTVKYGDKTVNGKSQVSFEITDKYIPVSYWNLVYIGDSIALPEYIVSDDGMRSYGYYFDNGEKVPYAFVPTHDVTITAKFADYNEVAGKYNIQAGAPNNSTYLLLNNDGTYKFVKGAMELTSTYYYDGNEIVLQTTGLAILGEYTDATLIENAMSYYYSFKATVEDGVMSIWDNDFFKPSAPLKAVKTYENFIYGEYYEQSGTSYTFYANGQVVIKSGSNVTNGYYFVEGDQVSITKGYDTLVGALDSNGVLTTIESESVNLIDKYKGVWESKTTTYKTYTFDGKGGYVYESFGYKNDNGETIKEVYETVNGTYQVNGDQLTIGTQNFSVDENGALEVVENGVTEKFYRENSFVGTWRFSDKKEPVEMQLLGVGLNGIGKATITYGTNKPFDLLYEATANGIILYYADLEIANLTINKVEKTLNGDLVSLINYTIVSKTKFCVYDEFKGDWVSDTEGFETVSFNGLGNYDLRGTSAYLAVKSSVTINGARVGAYTLESGKLQGSFTYNKKTYNISYNKNATITVTDGETTFVLRKYDNLKGVSLTDNNGFVISFDGRGLLSSGGKMITTDGEYTYTLNQGNINYTNGTESGVISVNSNGAYSFNDKELFVVNSFTGKWVVSNEVNGYLEIGNMRADFTASGTYLGESVTFVYDMANGYLYFEYQNETYYVFDLGAELLIGKSSYKQDNNAICIKYGKQDDFYGVFTSVDGRKTVAFDGLGESLYSNGIAIVKTNGVISAQFVYKINDGVMMLTDAYGVIYYLVESDINNPNAYFINDKYYEIKQVDILYNEFAYDADDVKFTFNGIGGVVCTKNNEIVCEYTYDSVVNDEVNFKVTMILTAKDGTTYDAVLDYSTYPYVITLTKINK